MKGNVAIVTSINRELLSSYGDDTLSTWRRNFDGTLIMISEDRLPRRVHGFDHVLTMPNWQQTFAAKYRHDPRATGRDVTMNKRGEAYDFRHDAVRFSHKVGAIWKVALNLDFAHLDWLIWCDADVIMTDKLASEWLDKLAPDDAAIAWLDRSMTYPECGFLIFNLRNHDVKTFIHSLANTYSFGDVFNLRQSHDSYVIEWLIEQMNTIKPHSLSGDARHHHHVFEKSVLAERMVHHKGNRKWVL